MVVTVVRGPPQRSSLHRGGPGDAQHELPEPVHAVGAVGEVPVVRAGDREHAEQVEPVSRQAPSLTGMSLFYS